jgi:hypothetical protein
VVHQSGLSDTTSRLLKEAANSAPGCNF